MTEPYYTDENVTLYHGDCLEHPEWWVGADVLITDPPYGIAHEIGRSTGRTRADRLAHTEWLRENSQYRIAGDRDTTVRDDALALWGDRPAMVFGHWRKPRPERTVMRLLWIKNEPGTGFASAKDHPWITRDEEIYVLASTQSEFANGSVDRNFIETRQLMSNVARHIDHPTPKPIGLMQWLLKKCKPEWTIADPFAGSGSTLVAAKALGRKAIGVELEERYCEVAARRLAQGVLDFGEWSA